MCSVTSRHHNCSNIRVQQSLISTHSTCSWYMPRQRQSIPSLKNSLRDGGSSVSMTPVCGQSRQTDAPSVSISLGLIGLSCNLVSGGPSRSYKRLFKHSYACTLLTHLPAALVNFRWQMTIAHLPNWRRMWKIHFIEFYWMLNKQYKYEDYWWYHRLYW